jgi:bifunctional non-homologous end joining protein LigD
MGAIAFIKGDAVKIFSRNGRDMASKLPGLAELPSYMGPAPMFIDGEMVCLDEHDKPSFSRLQQ